MLKNLSLSVLVSGSSLCKSVLARNTNSFVPPPPGIKPTPNSTKPMYVSAAAQTLSACKLNSQAPPKVKA